MGWDERGKLCPFHPIPSTGLEHYPVYLHGTEFQILERQQFEATLLPKFIDKDPLTAGGLLMGSFFADTNGDGIVNTKDITLPGPAMRPVLIQVNGFYTEFV
jgi:hypothetical protein